LSISSLHLGVDSAAPHIASAVGTPSVILFGPSDWRAWTVPGETHRMVTSDHPCVPCHNKGCDGKERSLCLEELGTEKVTKALSGVIAAIEANRLAAGATRAEPKRDDPGIHSTIPIKPKIFSNRISQVCSRRVSSRPAFLLPGSTAVGERTRQ